MFDFTRDDPLAKKCCIFIGELIAGIIASDPIS